MRFISSVRFDFHMTNSLSIAVHGIASCMLKSVSVDETLLPGQVNLSTKKSAVLCGDVAALIKEHIFRLVCIDMKAYACSCSFQTM